jgi:hypothetical protein
MKMIIRKQVRVEEHGDVLLRVGSIDIPDNTPPAAIPDTAMRLWTQSQGGSIADGVYEVAKSSELYRRRSAETRTSKITAEPNAV